MEANFAHCWTGRVANSVRATIPTQELASDWIGSEALQDLRALATVSEEELDPQSVPPRSEEDTEFMRLYVEARQGETAIRDHRRTLVNLPAQAKALEAA